MVKKEDQKHYVRVSAKSHRKLKKLKSESGMTMKALMEKAIDSIKIKGVFAVMLFVLSTPAFADDLCGCTKLSEDPVCKAYFELKELFQGEEGVGVKLTCEKIVIKEGSQDEQSNLRLSESKN